MARIYAAKGRPSFNPLIVHVADVNAARAIADMTPQAEAETDPAAAGRMMRANYLGPALLLGRVAARMATRGRGTIVGISSVAGDRGRASNYVYGSAKAGFTAFLSGLRARMARDGVRVITVKPGFVRTRMTEGMKLPGALTAEPEEVARAVCFLSGPDAEFVTGATLDVSGGWMMS